MKERFTAAGFVLVFQGNTPSEGSGPSYGHMLVRKTDFGSVAFEHRPTVGLN